jgi:Ran GTPase-activating protein (RanGAP) involved in mRNA processing and transport
LANVFEGSDLHEINLKDNAMGPRGLGRVASLFANSNLSKLNLENCGLSRESMEQLKEYINADNGRIAKTLTELVLDKNMIGVEGAEQVRQFLPHCVNLELFSYKGCRPVREGTKHIADGILDLVSNTEEPMIRHLDVNDSTFGNGDNDDEDAIVPFTKALSKCKRLRYLDLKDAAIEEGGLTLLVEAMKTSRAGLTHLLLDGNEIGTEGAAILAKWLFSQVPTLQVLHLGLNELGNEGVATIMEPFLVSSNEIQDLSLETNEIDNEGADALLMVHFPHLKRLNLAENDELEDDKKSELVAKFGIMVVHFDEDHEAGVNDLVARMQNVTV